MIGEELIDNAHLHDLKQWHIFSPTDMDPTDEQPTAIHALLQSGGAPYADLNEVMDLHMMQNPTQKKCGFAHDAKSNQHKFWAMHMMQKPTNMNAWICKEANL